MLTSRDYGQDGLMSKLLQFLFLLLFIALIGGFVYLAFVDVPVTQEEITENTTLSAIQKKAAP